MGGSSVLKCRPPQEPAPVDAHAPGASPVAKMFVRAGGGLRVRG
jgi:hypothetical protein